MNNRAFLETMSHTAQHLDHNPEVCGNCCYRVIMAEVARDMLLEAGDAENAVRRWTGEVKKRWENSKFFQLAEEERKAGRDPQQAFAERGWEM